MILSFIRSFHIDPMLPSVCHACTSWHSLEYRFYFTKPTLSASVICLITRQGFPAATTRGGISCVTMLPQPMTAPSPIVTPAMIFTSPAIHALSSIVIRPPMRAPWARSSSFSMPEGTNPDFLPIFLAHSLPMCYLCYRKD